MPMLVSAGSISTRGDVAGGERVLERVDVVELDDPRGRVERDRRADVAGARDGARRPSSSTANVSSTEPW